MNPLSADLNHILDHTRDLWNELRGQRIFITGGSGFFGCWLLESFLWANQKLDLNAQAVILTRRPAAVKKALPHLMLDPVISLYEGDVRTFAFPPGQFLHIIHAATESSTKLNSENPRLMLDTIVDGTRRTLEFAAHCRAHRLMLTSSGAVYGKQPPGMTHIPEEYTGAPDPFDPRSAYGQGKRLAEHLCTHYASNTLEIKIARGFAFVGPYLPLDSHFAIGNFIRDGLNGGPIIIKGDGTPHRSYLYAADLAIWLWTILLRGQSCRAYNVGSEESMSIAETARAVARSINPNVKVEIRGTPNPALPVEQYVPSVSRAKNELNLAPWVSLSESIKRTVLFSRDRM
jgi:nucleoside-diphosphate-sugar epimerase